MVVYKEVNISYGHMVEKEPKCGRMHGHNAKVEVWVEIPRLDENSMEMNFTAIGEIVKELDHKFLLPFDTTPWNSTFSSDSVSFDMEGLDGKRKKYKLPREDIFFLDVAGQVTAENIARHIVSRIKDSLKGVNRHIASIKVRVWETSTSYAEYIS